MMQMQQAVKLWVQAARLESVLTVQRMVGKTSEQLSLWALLVGGHQASTIFCSAPACCHRRDPGIAA